MADGLPLPLYIKLRERDRRMPLDDLVDAAGTITLEEREAMQEEAEEAWGELIVLAKMPDNRAMDDETKNA